MADKHAAGVEALERFWAQSHGGNAEWQVLYEELEALKLKDTELRRLKLNLPIPETQGTTAARIQRAAQAIDLLLER